MSQDVNIDVDDMLFYLLDKYIKQKINIYDVFVALVKETSQQLDIQAIEDFLKNKYSYKNIPLYQILKYIDNNLTDKEAKEIANSLYLSNTKLFSNLDYKKATIIITEHKRFKDFLKLLRSIDNVKQKKTN